VRTALLLLAFFTPPPAVAVPPPPVQVTANCDAPSYASDFLVCEDAGLRELDSLLARQIAQRNKTAAGSASHESDQDWFRLSRLCAFESDHRGCLLAAYCARITSIDRALADRASRIKATTPSVPRICSELDPGLP